MNDATRSQEFTDQLAKVMRVPCPFCESRLAYYVLEVDTIKEYRPCLTEQGAVDYGQAKNESEKIAKLFCGECRSGLYYGYDISHGTYGWIPALLKTVRL